MTPHDTAILAIIALIAIACAWLALQGEESG